MLSLDSKWCWFGEKVIVLGEHFCHQSFYKVRNMTDKQYRRKSYTELEKRSIQHTHKMIQKKHRKITDSMLTSSSSIENLSLKTVNDFFSCKFKHTQAESRLRLSFVILTVRYLTLFLRCSFHIIKQFVSKSVRVSWKNCGIFFIRSTKVVFRLQNYSNQHITFHLICFHLYK